MDWEIIFTICVPDKGFYQEYMNSVRQTIQLKNEKRLEQTLHKRRYVKVNKHRERFSTLFLIRKM